LAPNGFVSTFVRGSEENCEDKALSDVHAGLCGALSIAYNPADKSLYILDLTRVRRISSSGRLTTVGISDIVGRFANAENWLGFIMFDQSGRLYATGYHGIARAVPARRVRGVFTCGSTTCRDAVFCGVGLLGGMSATTFYNQDNHALAYRPNDGYLYMADFASVRRVKEPGKVSFVAGKCSIRDTYPTCTMGFVDGRGARARFGMLSGIAYNPFDGNLYVVDRGNHAIRRVSAAGDVSTVAGSPKRASTMPSTWAAEYVGAHGESMRVWVSGEKELELLSRHSILYGVRTGERYAPYRGNWAVFSAPQDMVFGHRIDGSAPGAEEQIDRLWCADPTVIAWVDGMRDFVTKLQDQSAVTMTCRAKRVLDPRGRIIYSEFENTVIPHVFRPFFYPEGK
jgi:hypothetical protein